MRKILPVFVAAVAAMLSFVGPVAAFDDMDLARSAQPQFFGQGIDSRSTRNRVFPAIAGSETGAATAEKADAIHVVEKNAPETKKRVKVITRLTTRLWQVFDKRHDKDEGGQNALLGDAFDLAYDRQADLLYVSSTFNRRIVVLRGSDGSVLRQFGPRVGDYELGVPLGLGIDGEGNLYVVDGKKNTVVVLTPDGGLISSFGERSAQVDGFFGLSDLASLDNGNALVVDSDRSCIGEYGLRDGSGSWVTWLVASDWECIPVFNPLAVIGDGKDLLFVIDNWGGRVSAFRLNKREGP